MSSRTPTKSVDQINIQALKQNLYTLDRISIKMLNELNNKNTILESGLAECNSFEMKNPRTPRTPNKK